MFSKIKIALVLLIILSSLKYSFAQEKLSYPVINSETYSQYLGEQWKELIKTGKKSLKAGIDFYYLQVRMGVANYKLKKYRQAIPYLEHALIESPEDEFVKEYLYFAYLFSGRLVDAQKMASDFTAKFKQKINIETKFGINAISFETKFDFWEDYRDYSVSSDVLLQDIQNRSAYVSFGLNSHFRNSSNLAISYSRVSITEEYSALNSLNVPIWDERDISQNQFYAKFNSNLTKGLNLTLAGNVLLIQNEETSSISSSGGQWGGGGSTSSRISTFTGEFIGYVGLSMDLSLIKLGLFSSFANLDNGTQIQPGGSLTIYPFGNTSLYTHSILNYQLESSELTTVQRLVFKQSIGINLWGVYLEPSYTFGEIYNLIELDGFIVNNYRDLITDRVELMAYTWLFKGKLNMFLKYQNYTRENIYKVNNIDQSINYNYETITGGIKWNF